MSVIEIKKLGLTEIALARELIEMFGFEDESGNRQFSSVEYTRRMLERADFHVIVALHNGKLVGSLTGYEMKMFKSETTEMFLYEIEVVESHRQKGIGKALIEFLKQICREKEIVQIFVGTEKDNFPA
ncbi:MAG: GNAT family N-acetyltransferase [Pyrinomonadaceae bacterium]|nr:GNAT family N-acetyltransferase [Pyrinomonadaceae bacterium]